MNDRGVARSGRDGRRLVPSEIPYEGDCENAENYESGGDATVHRIISFHNCVSLNDRRLYRRDNRSHDRDIFFYYSSSEYHFLSPIEPRQVLNT